LNITLANGEEHAAADKLTITCFENPAASSILAAATDGNSHNSSRPGKLKPSGILR
jgi:hypothetical protein